MRLLEIRVFWILFLLICRSGFSLGEDSNNKFRQRKATDDELGYPDMDEDASLNTQCPRNLELRWQTEVSSSIYATPLIADINSDGKLDIVVPSFLHYLEVLEGSDGDGTSPVFMDYGGIPMVGFYDRSSSLGASKSFPNFLRVVPGTYVGGRTVASVVQEFFGWDKVTMFYTNDEFSYTANFFQSYADELKISILSSHSFPPNQKDLSTVINLAKQAGSRIFVLFMSPTDAYNLINEGRSKGLFTRGSQLIGGESLSDLSLWRSAVETKLKLDNGDDGDIDDNVIDNKLWEILKGFISVKWKENTPSSPEVSKFISRYRSLPSTKGYVDNNGNMVCDNSTDYYGYHIYKFTNDNNGNEVCCGVDYSLFEPDSVTLKSMMYAYDAIIAIARGLHYMYYSDDSITSPSPAMLLKTLQKNVNFVGLTGNISFSSRFSDVNMDIGGRETGLEYNILNLQSQSQISSSSSLSSSLNNIPISISMVPFTSWNSESGFPSCKSENENENNVENKNHKYSHYYQYYSSSSSCYQLTFNTKDSTTPPLDSPSPILEEMPEYLRELLMSLSVMCLFWILFDIGILYFFRSRRLVKMSQLSLTIIAALGSLLSVFRVMLSSIDLSTSVCMGIFWTSHLSFLLVFSTLLVRAWRVSAITSSLKKVIFGDSKCIKIITSLLIVGVLDMIFETIFGGVEVVEVVIEDNQFENTYQMRCDYSVGLGILGLYIYEGLILLFGLYFCWKIRKVNLTVCNTTSIIDASSTVIITIIVMVTVLYTVEIEPIYRQFYIALTFILVTGRVMWVLDSRVIYLVLMGYDLDKSLTLHQNSWSIKNLLPRSSRTTKISMEDASTDRDIDTFSRRADLVRFTKDKNQNELTAEIIRANHELLSITNYIASLENLRFAADAVNNSSSYVDSSNQYKIEEIVQIVEKDISEVPPTPAAHDPPTPAHEAQYQKF